MDAALGGTATEAIEVVRCVASQWRSDFDYLLPAFSLAFTLRQAIAACQQTGGDGGAEAALLWPGLATNPLARLHIIIVDNGVKGGALEALKVIFF